MIPSTVQGTVAGTGAAINVVIGFKPDYLLVTNRVTGAKMERFRTSANSIKTVVAGTVTVVSGATAKLLDYEGTTGDGFTIPIDAQVNVSGENIDYIAVRSGPGAK